MTISVVVADDETVVRAGLRLILECEDDIVVVAEAPDGQAAVDAVRALRPDVVLMDIRMPGCDGIEATRRVLSEPAGRTRVLVLTTLDVDEFVYEALRAGASGFLLKSTRPEQLIEGVRVVADGEALMSPSITRRLIEEFARRPVPSGALEHRLRSLTPRETEILVHVARGLSNAEIATKVFVSEATVKAHLGKILQKLDLRDRVQAVVLAYEVGLVRAGEAGVGPA